MRSPSVSMVLVTLLLVGVLVFLQPLLGPTGTSHPISVAAPNTVLISMGVAAGDPSPPPTPPGPAFTGVGDPQTLKGSNGATSIVANGNYSLTMRVIESIPGYPTSCPPRPGRIAWQAGLIASVQANTPRSGGLSFKYDKTSADTGHVDSWITSITSAGATFDYTVSIFRWTSRNFVNNADGSSTVFFRGGSVEVFKKQQGKFIAREQCFGQYVNFDLTAK